MRVVGLALAFFVGSAFVSAVAATITVAPGIGQGNWNHSVSNTSSVEPPDETGQVSPGGSDAETGDQAAFLPSQIWHIEEGRCSDDSWSGWPLAPRGAEQRRYRCVGVRIAYLEPTPGYNDTSVQLTEGGEGETAIELLGVRSGSGRLPISKARYAGGPPFAVEGICTFRMAPPSDEFFRIVDVEDMRNAVPLGFPESQRDPVPIVCDVSDSAGRQIASVTLIPRPKRERPRRR